MTYRIKLGDTIHTLDAQVGENGETFVLAMDDRELSCSARRIDDHRLELIVDGNKSLVSLARDKNGVWIAHDGAVRFVENAESRSRRGRVTAEGPREVTPATPANVVRVLASVGDRVTKGQGLVVVSAMKMESTLNAPYDGTITAINCEAGALVKPGEILVEIEPEKHTE